MNQQTKDIDKEWCLINIGNKTILIHKHEDWNKPHLLCGRTIFTYCGVPVIGGGFVNYNKENFSCGTCGMQAPDHVKYVALLAFVKKFKDFYDEVLQSLRYSDIRY